MKAELLVAVAAALGEGPVWRAETEEILWTDILRGEVHASVLDGADRVVARLDCPVGAVALSESGALVLAVPGGLASIDGTILAPLESEAPDLRMNDGKPDPVGRFVGGTMTLGEARTGAGSLWSFSGSGRPARLVAGATIPNGIAWSADGSTMFWIDTPTQRVDAFDYNLESGLVANRRPWASVEGPGSPDGMCIDADGGLWVAMWGGSSVRRYVDGVLDEVVDVPTPLVTCPTFAGPDLDRLVVTTASVGQEPGVIGAGALYVACGGFVGLGPKRLGRWVR
jgi:sugar lactone lactonase YvrE